MKPAAWALYGTILTLLVGCSGEKPVSLHLDPSAREHWAYRFRAVMSGSAQLADSKLSFADTLEALLEGQATSGDTPGLTISPRDVALSSTVIDPIEAEAIRYQMEKSRLTIALRDGYLSVQADSTQTAFSSGKWDLYRHLIRLLPVLPKPKAKPGFSWDREAHLPLHTDYGPASARLYQAFTFDSVHSTPQGSREAHLSWRFRYSVDPDDTAGYLGKIPRAGMGSGEAVLDLDKHVLLRAATTLIVAPSDDDPLGITWHERGELVLTQGAENAQ